MPRRKTFNFAPAAVDPNGIAESQTPLAGGNLTLDGALGTTLDYARFLVITSDDNDSGRTFTVTGTDPDGKVVTEAITGPNATTVEGAQAFKTITSIAVDAATAGAILVGTTDTIISATYPLNRLDNYSTQFAAIISGTINYSVEETYENVQTSTAGAGVTWTANAASGKTANFQGTVFRASAVRFKITSYSSGATLKVTVNQGR